MEHYICVHGHFYQPPRHNPWLAVIERQDSAHPYHDWNERITAECYTPQTAARILDTTGRIIRIVNNYASMSFNFGPTLLAWLEQHAPATYAAILDADKLSQQRFAGHGSALAQAYNHLIMPLANQRDKHTQITWGIEDFVHRFQRPPEGMWLPETAVDLETLEFLAAAGLQFTILAPTQARRIRPLGSPSWENVSHGNLDPSRPYIQSLPSGRRITLFFYHARLAQQVAFERLLDNGQQFAERLVSALDRQRSTPQLIHIATDGETYGHHHRFGEMALAYALHHIESHGLARLTNYGAFLAQHPPTYEVDIQEQTSWSCAHGVERWRSNCGCRTGGHPTWQQHWRAPLRAALDWLRDRLIAFYEQQGKALFHDPWAAREDYIALLLDHSSARRSQFLAKHTTATASAAPQLPLMWLEMQHQAMLMYTSCGWFFDELSGLEPRQILLHAARAIQLALALGAPPSLETTFLERLARAPSNVPTYRHGRHLYEHWIKPAIPRWEQLAVQFAMQGLLTQPTLPTAVYIYSAQATDVRHLAVGNMQLLLGRVHLTTQITQEAAALWFGVVHYGDHHLYGGARLVQGTGETHPCLQEACEALQQSDVQALIRLFYQHFHAAAWPLHALRPDAQRTILTPLLASATAATAEVYRQLYTSHLPLVHALTRLRMPLPPALRDAATYLWHTHLEQALAPATLDVPQVKALIAEGRRAGLWLEASTLQPVLERTLEHLAARLAAEALHSDHLPVLVEMLHCVRSLPWQVNIWQVQNVCYTLLHSTYRACHDQAAQGDQQAREWVRTFRSLADLASVYIEPAC